MRSPGFHPLAALERGRGVFRLVGAGALLVLGAHLAADVVDDGARWGLGLLDALVDLELSRVPWSAPLIGWVGVAERDLVARGLALVWELLADGVLLFALVRARSQAPSRAALRGLWARAVAAPQLGTWSHAFAAAVFTWLGAWAVGSAVYGTARIALGASWAELPARLVGVLTGAALLFALGPGALMAGAAPSSSPLRAPSPALAGWRRALVLLPLALAGWTQGPALWRLLS